MDNVKAFEPYLATPLAEIGPRKIESITEFDEHVQRHEQTEHVLAARIIDERFDGNQSAAWRQCFICLPNELHLLFQVPVVKNHSHGDEIGLGQRIVEKVTGGRFNAFTETG